eukprot:SAG31_NODE_45774_length_257_cov_0.974684_1_plen_54_part_10
MFKFSIMVWIRPDPTRRRCIIRSSEPRERSMIALAWREDRVHVGCAQSERLGSC